MTAPKEKPQSLADFAAERMIPPCRLCACPDRDEADAGLRGGIRKGLVLAWLEERGHSSVTEHSIETHMKKKHHFGEKG